VRRCPRCGDPPDRRRRLRYLWLIKRASLAERPVGWQATVIGVTGRPDEQTTVVSLQLTESAARQVAAVPAGQLSVVMLTKSSDKSLPEPADTDTTNQDPLDTERYKLDRPKIQVGVSVPALSALKGVIPSSGGREGVVVGVMVVIRSFPAYVGMRQHPQSGASPAHSERSELITSKTVSRSLGSLAPPSSRCLVRTYVSPLRAVLGREAIERSESGPRMQVQFVPKRDRSQADRFLDSQKRAVSRGECTTGLTWDPREGSHRPNSGQARGRPMREPAYEPRPGSSRWCTHHLASRGKDSLRFD
jgi:hypothetical protein